MRGSKPIVISRVASSPTVDRSVKELPSRSSKAGRFRPPWFLVRGTGMSVHKESLLYCCRIAALCTFGIALLSTTGNLPKMHTWWTVGQKHHFVFVMCSPHVPR